MPCCQQFNSRMWLTNGLTVALQSGGPCVPFANTDIPQQRYDCVRDGR